MEDLRLWTNEELVTALRLQFDDTMFEELLWRFRPLIRHFMQMYSILHFDEEDYIQETRIVLQIALDRYRGESLYFAGFFKKSLRNHWINLCKHQGALKRVNWAHCLSIEANEHNLAMDVMDSLCLSPEEHVIIAECKKEYWSHLSKLEKSVFSVFLQGRTVEEIATEVGTTEEKCRNALDRCRSKLQLYLKKPKLQ